MTTLGPRGSQSEAQTRLVDGLITGISFVPLKRRATSPTPATPPIALLRPSYTVVEDRVVCLDVKTREPEIESICNTMDFFKLEIEVNPKCTLGIKYVHVNGVLTTLPTFETFGPQDSRALIKCPNINLDINNASGSQICLTLSENCPTWN
eukprot:gene15595-21699_t